MEPKQTGSRRDYGLRKKMSGGTNSILKTAEKNKVWGLEATVPTWTISNYALLNNE